MSRGRVFFRLLTLLAALPVFCIIGFLIAGPLLKPGFEPVDVEDPPRDLAVMAVWDADGRLACRAFYYQELQEHTELLPPMRYRVSAEEFSLCSASFRAFNNERRWGDDFEWERSAFVARVEADDADDPTMLTVTYPPDDDHPAETRYRIDPASGEPTDFEFEGYFGPGWGAGVIIVGGGGGIIVWLLLVAVVGVSWLRRRRAEAHP